MKAIKITYWITTVLICLMMTYSAYAYLTQEQMKQAFVHLGFPNYFRMELAIAKLIGVILLLAPVAKRLKEWAYAGFTITFISAFIAHTASGDPASVKAAPMVFLAILIVSYITFHRKNKVIA